MHTRRGAQRVCALGVGKNKQRPWLALDKACGIQMLWLQKDNRVRERARELIRVVVSAHISLQINLARGVCVYAFVRHVLCVCVCT